MNSRKVWSNFAELSSGHVVAKAIALFGSAVLARGLGSRQLGILASLMTILGYLMILTNWGTDSIGIREVAREGGTAGALRSKILRTRGALALLAMAVFLLTITLIRLPLGVGVLLGLSLPVFAFREDWLLLGYGRARAVAGSAIIRELSFLILVVFVVARSGSLLYAALAFVIAEAMWATATRVFTSGAHIAEVQGPERAGVLKAGFPLMIMSLMSITYNKVDTPLLAAIKGPSEAGHYWCAYSVMFAVLGLSAMLGRAALPELSRGLGSRPETKASFLYFCLLSCSVGWAAAIGVSASAGAIVGVAYGPAFAPAADALRVLAWAIPLNVTSGLMVNRLVAERRERATAWIAGVAAVANVALNLAWIPTMGMRGAALATLSAESLMVIGALIALAEAQLWRLLVPGLLGGASISAGLVLGVARWLPTSGFALGIALALMFLLAAAPALLTAGRVLGRTVATT